MAASSRRTPDRRRSEAAAVRHLEETMGRLSIVAGTGEPRLSVDEAEQLLAGDPSPERVATVAHFVRSRRDRRRLAVRAHTLRTAGAGWFDGPEAA